MRYKALVLISLLTISSFTVLSLQRSESGNEVEKYVISLGEIEIKTILNYSYILPRWDVNFVYLGTTPPLPAASYIYLLSPRSEVVSINYQILDEVAVSLPLPLMNFAIRPFSAHLQNNPPLKYSHPKLLQYSEFTVRGLHFINIKILPFKYFPDNLTLIYFKKLRLEITKEESTRYISLSSIPVKSDTILMNLLNDSDILNHKIIDTLNKISLSTSSIASLQLSANLSSYDSVIITPSAWLSHAERYAKWRSELGKLTYVKTVEDIYAEYSGIDNPQKIRNFIKEAYTTWNIEEVILLGDVNYIPTRYIFNNDTEDPELGSYYKPTDWYYAGLYIDTQYGTNDGWYAYSSELGAWGWGYPPNLADDGRDHIQWVPDLLVARIPAASDSELTAYLTKLMSYTSNPPPGNWSGTMILAGGVLDDPWSFYDYKSSLRNQVLKNHVEYYKTYYNYVCGDPRNNLTRTSLINGLNAGASLVEWAIHGNIDIIGDCEGIHLYASDALSLTNTGRLSLVFSMSCLTNAFDASTTCMGEAFLRNTGSGGLWYIGWARITWAVIPTYLLEAGYSETIDTKFWEYFFSSGSCQVGKSLFQSVSYYGTNWKSSNDEVRRKVRTSIHLLGEPSIDVWTANPQHMIMNVPSVVDIQQVVEVDTLPNSLVVISNISKGFYVKGYADSSGRFLFTAPSEPMSLNIISWKHNYIHANTSIDVINAQLVVTPGERKGPIGSTFNFTVVFNPDSGTPNFSSLMTVGCGDVDWGNYSLRVRAEGPGLSLSRNVTISLTSVALIPNPSELYIIPGNTTHSVITVSPSNHHNTSVTLSHNETPPIPDSTISLNPEEGIPEFNSNLQVQTSETTTVGIYNITVSARLTSNRTINVTLPTRIDRILLSPDASEVLVEAGDEVCVAIAVAFKSGLNGSVAVNWSSSSYILVDAPSTLNAPDALLASIHPRGSTPEGIYPVTFNFSLGEIFNVTTINVIVYRVSANLSSRTLDYQGSPKTTFTRGEVVLIEISIIMEESQYVNSSDATLFIQIYNPSDYIEFFGVSPIVMVEGEEVKVTMGYMTPFGAQTGTYRYDVMLWDDWEGSHVYSPLHSGSFQVRG